MSKFRDMFSEEHQILLDFYAKAIGEIVLAVMLSVKLRMFTKLVERNAMDLVTEIKKILDDKTIEDPDCFCRINAIVDAFYEAGLETDRHD